MQYAFRGWLFVSGWWCRSVVSSLRTRVFWVNLRKREVCITHWQTSNKHWYFKTQDSCEYKEKLRFMMKTFTLQASLYLPPVMYFHPHFIYLLFVLATNRTNKGQVGRWTFNKGKNIILPELQALMKVKCVPPNTKDSVLW